ncbi:11878_t:CDS:2, partial [Scutellospora calospora]
MSEENIKKLQEQLNVIRELEQRQSELNQEVIIRNQYINNQNLTIKQYEQKTLDQVSEIVDKRFNDNEKQDPQDEVRDRSLVDHLRDPQEEDPSFYFKVVLMNPQEEASD